MCSKAKLDSLSFWKAVGRSTLDTSIRWFMHLTPNPGPAQLSSGLLRSPVCEAKTVTEWTDPILASCLCGFVLGHHSAALSWQEGTGKILEWDLCPVASSSHCGCISPRCRISLGSSPTLPATPLPLTAAIDYLLRYKKCSKFRPVDESSSAGCESGQDDL